MTYNVFSGTLNPTQSTVNEYRSKCGDAVWLASNIQDGSFHMRINKWVASKSV